MAFSEYMNFTKFVNQLTQFVVTFCVNWFQNECFWQRITCTGDQCDDHLNFESFYNGFMAPYFGCHSCEDTRKGLKVWKCQNIKDQRSKLILLSGANCERN